jgi:nucleoside-diphosphate-sugar epimerase
VEPLYNTSERGGVRRLYADITTAQRLLDFSPRVSLDEGLRLTLLRDLKYRPNH